MFQIFHKCTKLSADYAVFGLGKRYFTKNKCIFVKIILHQTTMIQEKYDIFISYRRRDKEGNEWGTPIARNIQQALESRGYMGRVFFDHNEIGPEDFEEKILGAIKQSKVFICVLTKDAMDNCVREGDWVRREICQAIESEKKMIFLNPDNQFTYNFPVDFPEELRIVRKGNSIDIRMGQKFEIDMDDLVNTHIAPNIKPSYIVKRKLIVENAESVAARINSDLDYGDMEIKAFAIIHILADHDCKILRYGKEVGLVQSGKYTEVKLPKGKNKLEFISLKNEQAHCEYMLDVRDVDYEDYLDVKLLDKLHEVELLNLMDNEFGRYEDNRMYGLRVMSTGERITSCKYNNVGPFSEGLAKVKVGNKWGYVDKTGKEVTPLKYDFAGSVNEGLARVMYGGKWGFVNKYGDEVISLRYDYVEYCDDGLINVMLDDKWGFVDKNGRVVVRCIYDAIYRGKDNVIYVQYKDKWGCIDKTGKDILLCIYDKKFTFDKDGYAKVVKYGKSGVINVVGDEVIPLKYDDIITFLSCRVFEQGIVKVKLNGKYGFVDKTGKEVIPLKYDAADIYYSEGLARVKLSGKWGCIDKSGRVVIPLIYDNLGTFSYGLAMVNQGGKFGFVDILGRVIIPLKYDDAISFGEYYGEGEPLTGVKLNGKWGFIDISGIEVIPLIYDFVSIFSGTTVDVELNGEKFCIDKNGNRVK